MIAAMQLFTLWALGLATGLQIATANNKRSVDTWKRIAEGYQGSTERLLKAERDRR